MSALGPRQMPEPLKIIQDSMWTNLQDVAIGKKTANDLFHEIVKIIEEIKLDDISDADAQFFFLGLFQLLQYLFAFSLIFFKLSISDPPVAPLTLPDPSVVAITHGTCFFMVYLF